MQALVLFIMFGVLAATIGSIIGNYAEGTAAFIQRMEEAQSKVFDDIQTVLLGIVVPNALESPDTGLLSNRDPAVYMCQNEDLQRVVPCRTLSGTLGMVDMWGNRIQGRLHRFNGTTVHSFAPGALMGFNVPVTAYVLVSGGADGIVDVRLQQAINSLGSSPDIRTMLGLAAYRTTTGAAGQSTDDIVVTFSDQRAQETNLAGLSNAISRIGAAALRYYQGRVAVNYANIGNAYEDIFEDGPITLDDDTLNQWQTPTGVSFAAIASNFNLLGADEDRTFIQRTLPTGGGFDLTTNSSVSDCIDYTLTPRSGTNWSLAVAPNCRSTANLACTSNCVSALSINCIRVQGGS